MEGKGLRQRVKAKDGGQRVEGKGWRQRVEGKWWRAKGGCKGWRQRVDAARRHVGNLPTTSQITMLGPVLKKEQPHVCVCVGGACRHVGNQGARVEPADADVAAHQRETGPEQPVSRG